MRGCAPATPIPIISQPHSTLSSNPCLPHSPPPIPLPYTFPGANDNAACLINAGLQVKYVNKAQLQSTLRAEKPYTSLGGKRSYILWMSDVVTLTDYVDLGVRAVGCAQELVIAGYSGILPYWYIYEYNSVSAASSNRNRTTRRLQQIAAAAAAVPTETSTPGTMEATNATAEVVAAPAAEAASPPVADQQQQAVTTASGAETAANETSTAVNPNEGLPPPARVAPAVDSTVSDESQLNEARLRAFCSSLGVPVPSYAPLAPNRTRIAAARAEAARLLDRGRAAAGSATSPSITATAAADGLNGTNTMRAAGSVNVQSVYVPGSSCQLMMDWIGIKLDSVLRAALQLISPLLRVAFDMVTAVLKLAESALNSVVTLTSPDIWADWVLRYDMGRFSGRRAGGQGVEQGWVMRWHYKGGRPLNSGRKSVSVA